MSEAPMPLASGTGIPPASAETFTRVKPTKSTNRLSREAKEGQALDALIEEKLSGIDKGLAGAYLEAGAALEKMQSTKNYVPLGYGTWEGYLKAKGRYGLTFLSYLLKLGKAEGLAAQLEKGLGGSQLIEYAKHSPQPRLIPALIEATWDEVKTLPIRQLADKLRAYVAEHPDAFPRRVTPAQAFKRPKTVKDRLSKQFRALNTGEEKADFLRQLNEFLEEHRVDGSEEAEAGA